MREPTGRARSTSFVRAFRKQPQRKAPLSEQDLDKATRNIATLAGQKDTGITRPTQKRGKKRCSNMCRREAAGLLGVEEIEIQKMVKRCPRSDNLIGVEQVVRSHIHLSQEDMETKVA